MALMIAPEGASTVAPAEAQFDCHETRSAGGAPHL
jgi:hypothetical protein